MYSMKSVRPRMDPWGTPALTGYSCEDFSSRTTWSLLLLKKRRNKAKYLTWNSVRPKFVKKTSLLNSVENLGYMKCDSLSSPRPVKSPSNSIRHNCQKICNWSRRSKIILEIRKKAIFLEVINNPIIYRFFKDFTNHEKKTNRAVVFSSWSFPQHSEIQGPLMRPSVNLENKTLSDMCWRVQLVCIKVQAHSSLEPPLEYNQNQTPLMNQCSLLLF